MGAIGLNPIRLDRIGLDPIRINAIKLGVPGAASDRPYIDPEVLASLKAVCICYGKSNDDPDRAVVKNLVDPDNPFVISNAAYTEGSGYADKDSPYYGAFVTDGIDDLITSTKTVQEMLGGSNEITVVSMIHQVKDSSNNVSFTNYIRGSANGYFRNIVNNYDKTGIYGYTSSDLMGLSVVNNILGDKNDYTSNGDNRDSIINGNFSVQGYSYNDGNNTGDFSSVAWYWTIIANKVLTTDQINQVIAYYNLDRCVEPTVLYDVKRQGLSNDTPDSDWYLKDFSKNGFDMSLFNFAKKGNSGVGKYETDLSDTRIWTQSRDVTSSPFSSSYNGLSGWIIFANTELTNSADMPSFKIQVKGLLEGQELIYRYYDSTGQTNVYSMTKDGEYTLPADVRTAKPLTSNTSGFQVVKNDTNSITITQIPSHAGALCLGGVDDYGKVTGLPIYKDYTVVADREIIDGLVENADGGVALKGSRYLTGAFCFDYKDAAFSFGTPKMIPLDTKRFISYQSKYVSNGISINIGTATDNDELWIGRLGNDERYSKIAIRFLMSFPYSMSEFLIERQLKKHKLGTLYPDMVEFRPIVKSNLPYSSISYSVNPGEYISVDSMVTITITLPNTSDKLMEVSCNAISDISISGDNGVYEITGKVGKSPQKINMIISSYLTMLNNETLISNETLIKNE